MKKRGERIYHAPVMTGFETCAGCFSKFAIKKFSICSSKLNGRKSLCQDCDSLRERIRQVMIRANKRPHMYSMCDSCDYVFYRYKTASSTMRNNKEKIKKEKCPHCGSKNIINY